MAFYSAFGSWLRAGLAPGPEGEPWAPGQGPGPALLRTTEAGSALGHDPPPVMGVEDVDGEHVSIVLPRLLCKRDSKGTDAPSDEETHHQEPIVYPSHKRPYPVEVRASESDIERADEKIAATVGTIVINDTETIDSDMYVLGSFSTEASETFGAPNLIHPRPVPLSCILTPSQLAS